MISSINDIRITITKSKKLPQYDSNNLKSKNYKAKERQTQKYFFHKNWFHWLMIKKVMIYKNLQDMNRI